MNKILKRIISTIGLIFVTFIFILNIIYTATMAKNEVVTIKGNSFIFIVSSLILVALVYVLCKELNSKTTEFRKKYLIFGLVIFMYFIEQMVIIHYCSVKPNSDQETAYNLAIAIKEKNVQDFLDNSYTYEGAIVNRTYIERYSQQIPLAFVWSILLRIFNNNSYIIIEYFNAFCNLITVVSIFLICKELSKKYKVNKYLAMSLILLFLSIPLLVTFIYGDVSGMGLAMLGTYFIIKYGSEKNIKYLIYSIISMAISYMLRMNFLIFILAILIYLFLDLIDKKENAKGILMKILAIFSFAVLTLAPATIVKNYYLKENNLDSKKSFPMTGYFYMGMTVSDYSAGWYSYKYADYAYRDIENANEKYISLIKDRINHFIDNPSYAMKFYLVKICSMWTENNNSTVRQKILLDENDNVIKEEGKQELEDIHTFPVIYQKVLILIIFGCTMVVIIQNRKNLSNEFILFLTIFIGGFLFHIIWEAKSRYIIPYIVALIPIASIEIEKIKFLSKDFWKRRSK